MNRTVVWCSWTALFLASNGVFIFWNSDAEEPRARQETGLEFSDNHDELGKFFVGEKVQFALQLSNSGSESLSINSIKADCACTNVKADSHVIQPRGSVTVTGSIRPKREPGKYEHQVQVRPTEGAKGVATCRLSYQVASRFALDPPKLQCKASFLLDTPQATRFRLMNNSGKEVAFRDAQVDLEGVSIKLGHDKLKHSASCVLEIVVDGSNPVPRAGMISLWTDHEDERLLRFLVSIQPTHPVTVIPPSVNWGLVAMSGDGPRGKTIRLVGDLLTTSELLDINLPEFVRGAPVRCPDERTYEIDLEVDRSFLSSDQLDLLGAVTFAWRHTITKKEFEIVVPVTGYLIP